MKKFFATLLSLSMVFALAACGNSGSSTPETPASTGGTSEATPVEPAATGDGGTIYVLGPTPDHGWTAQAGSYADKRVAEINAEGNYKAVYMASSSGEEQVDQVQTILANGDAVGVVFFALEDSAKSGQEALIAADVPFISFDRIIEGPDAYATLNFSGDNWQVGAGIAYWLQQKGLEPGETLVTLIGDNGTVCSRRQEGFEKFLMGEMDYEDASGAVYTTDRVWTQEEVNALTGTYKTVCDWSADGAYGYLEQSLSDIVAAAKNSTGNLYVFSQDDEMTFGFLNLLEGNAIDEGTKADLEELNVYVSAIGGMAELFAVMDGTSTQSALADQYFDDMCSMWFSPSMMITAMDYMEAYLSGDWDYEVGAGEYEATWVVDRNNVGEYEGFTGH